MHDVIGFIAYISHKRTNNTNNVYQIINQGCQVSIRFIFHLFYCSCLIKVTNDEVLRRVQQKSELLQTIKKRKVEYLGHIIRHDRYELLQLIMMGKVAGKRRVGRRKKLWLRNIRDWTGIESAAQLFRLARDQEEYAKLTANLR
ncbi:hypothetical protein ABMA28_004110 [Loxostege sticticalis]|uniref:Uncharacterized protein n=1 Tax=Loxostege sticticalis TaxID=481309 RepID=A0ABD0SU88_LOXSC